MNGYAAYPKPVPGGFRVMLRFKHLVSHLNGPEYRRDGAIIEAQSTADQAFNLKPFRQRGNKRSLRYG